MPTLAAYFHDLSPFIFRISGDLGLRWYGFAYASAFILSYFILVRMGKSGLSLLKPHRVMDAMMYLVLGVVLGGRLGYLLFYDDNFHSLRSFNSSFPFWGALRLNEGGMASHGGMVGVILATFLISRGFKDHDGIRRDGVPKLHLLDILAAVTPLGLCLGRLANFINGELLGRIVAEPGQPAPWWSVKFPQELTEFAYVRISGTRAAPSYSLEQNAQINDILHHYAPNAEDRYVAAKAVLDILHSASSSTRADLAAKLDPLVSARIPSQLLQAAAEGPLLALVLWLIWRAPRAPGVIGCWFMITYGILRILTEFWRLPDAHLLSPRIFGLSRGQWLSAAMVAVGAAALPIVLTRAKRLNISPIAGWAKKA
jgi:phosphatidylglycerol:prolipoprotein diacylglycerol transferase